MLARGVGEVKGLAVRTRELRPRRAKAFVTKRAARLIYTCEQVSGARAAEIGLYDEAAPAAQIRTRADKPGPQRPGAGGSAFGARHPAARAWLAALPAAMDHENAEQISLSRTRDARAGIRAAVSGASRFSLGSKRVKGRTDNSGRRAEDPATVGIVSGQ